MLPSLKKILLSTLIMTTLQSFEPAQAGVFNPETFELKNGLKTIIIPNKRSRSGIQVMLWYPVGSADEKKDKHGLAHFLEHLMFRGTHKNGPGSYDKIVTGFGGENNAFTSWDFTGYFVKVSRDYLEPILALEADRIYKGNNKEGLKIIDDVFKPEKLVVLEEMTTTMDNNPNRFFDRRMRQALFKGHPYAIEIIGPRKEVENLTAEDAMDFYRTYYGVQNVTLLIEGNVTKAEMQPLVEKHFGHIQGAPRKTRVRTPIPEQKEPLSIVVGHPLVTQPKLVRYYRAPSYVNSSSKEMLTLEVLQNLLGGGETSYLHQKMVIESENAAHVIASFNPGMYDANVFAIYVIPSQGVDLKKIEAALDQHLQNFLNAPVNQKDLNRIKNRMLADNIYARDGLGNGAEMIGHILVNGGSINDVEKMPETIQSITTDDIKKAAQKVLNQKAYVTGQLIAEAKK